MPIAAFTVSCDICTSLLHLRAMLRLLLTSLPPFFFTMLPQVVLDLLVISSELLSMD